MAEAPSNIRQALLEKLSGSGAITGVAKVNAHTILKNLDSQFVAGYIQKLEEAIQFLKNYMYEIDALDKRMAKMSTSLRASLGGRAIDKKRAAINRTLSKLRAHQAASVDRLLPE